MKQLEDSVKAKKKQSPRTEVEISLKEEVWNHNHSSLNHGPFQDFLTEILDSNLFYADFTA